jgi:dolichyl-phosphate beta-glucosyltransferase
MHDPAAVTVSVVVPAYNEEDRMPQAMAEMTSHLTAMEEAGQPDGSPFSWEIIVVDDGSSDGTAAVAAGLTKQWGGDRVRVLHQVKNTGKGGAVRKGMMRARGEYLLMADADGATSASDLSRLLAGARAAERGGLSVAIGSRAHMQDGGAGSAPAATTAAGAAAGGQRSVKRSAVRRVLMWGFHTFVSMMAGGSGIKDTQCGFKLFSRAAARQLFPVQHIERWAFDVELVYLAARKRIPMVVGWGGADGSSRNQAALMEAQRWHDELRNMAVFVVLSWLWGLVTFWLLLFFATAPCRIVVSARTPTCSAPPAVIPFCFFSVSIAAGGARDVARDGGQQGGPCVCKPADGARHCRHSPVLHGRHLEGCSAPRGAGSRQWSRWSSPAGRRCPRPPRVRPLRRR